MAKLNSKEHIEKNLAQGDSLVGFFYANTPLNYLKCTIGILGAFIWKYYVIAITKNGICFYKLNLAGNIVDSKFFEYHEIEKVKFGIGLIEKTIKFYLKGGGSIKVKALLKGRGKAAKLTKSLQEHIERNIIAV